MYRWIGMAVRIYYPDRETTPWALFPVKVEPSGPITYQVRQNGLRLSLESQEMVLPGDYGIYNTNRLTPQRYYRFQRQIKLSKLQKAIENFTPALAVKTAFPPSFRDKAIERDRQCVLTGSTDSDALTALWIIPPSLGYMLSDDRSLLAQYQLSPDSCDMSHTMVLANVLSIHENINHLFRDNALGIDVDDNYRIVVFEPRPSYPSINTHLTLADGPDRPSDQFLRLHFEQCLVASAFGGDLTEDFKEGESFSVALEEMEDDDPLRQSFLGIQLEAYYARVQERLENSE